MLRLRASLVLSVLLLPVVARGQSDTALWRFIYPSAKAVINIDWARIRQSQAGAMIREQFLTPGAMPAIPGIELLNDIDRVLISSPGKNSSDDSAETPILIAIQGHFETAKVRQLFTRLGAKAQSYNSFQVYRPQGKDPKDTAWVLFDSGTILFGDAPSIFSALDRSQFSSPPLESGSIVARATQLAANYEFWVIMDATEIMASDQVAALFRGGEWMSEAQGFDAGLNLNTGLAADVIVRFSSEAAAKRVTNELSRMMNLAGKDKSTGAEVQDIARKLKFSLDGSATKISLRLTPQELEKSAQAFAASHKASAQMAASAGASQALPDPPPVPAKPGVIRIEGLDEGPREIPFLEPQH
jgi:hypothetical protein